MHACVCVCFKSTQYLNPTASNIYPTQITTEIINKHCGGFFKTPHPPGEMILHSHVSHLLPFTQIFLYFSVICFNASVLMSGKLIQ